MFAGKPPSSSDPMKPSPRKISSVLNAFRRLLLQIGGANITSPDRALERIYFVVVRGTKSVFPLSSSARRVARSGFDCLAAKLAVPNP
jgi:hypothetical protein